MVTYTPTNIRRSGRLSLLVTVGIGAAAMATWIKAHQVGFTFLTTVIVGLLLITAAAFTISPGLGLLTAGLCSLAGGHWITYLRTTGAPT